MKSSIASIASVLGARYYKLPSRKYSKVCIQKDLEVPMSDGVILRADRYFPPETDSGPLILIRSPYGRRGAWGIYARWFAERGFQVLIQSCRGTTDSEGHFEPLVNEAGDGLDTVAWLRNQPWFDDTLATWGASYLGYVQWALISEDVPELQAMAIQVAPSEFRNQFMYHSGAFSIGNALGFLQVIHSRILREGGTIKRFISQFRSDSVREKAAMTVPLCESDTEVIGKSTQYFQNWIDCDTNQSYWDPINHRDNVENAPRIQLICGWYDFFLDAMLEDYRALRDADRDVQLIIGSNAHGAGQTKFTLNEQFEWLTSSLLDSEEPQRSKPRVRVNLIGTDIWLGFEDWPPTKYTPMTWFLNTDGKLTRNEPTHSPPDTYRFDPMNPTPNIGGPIISLKSGQRNQNKKVARDDVLTYTSPTLKRDLDVVGKISAELYIKSTRRFTDFYVGLCDVDESGTSRNVCDGFIRLSPDQIEFSDQEPSKTEISLRPIAYRFNEGHKIQIQVASGCFPRWSRNPGTGECIADASSMKPADQQVFHQPNFPSNILLPIFEEHR